MRSGISAAILCAAPVLMALAVSPAQKDTAPAAEPHYDMATNIDVMMVVTDVKDVAEGNPFPAGTPSSLVTPFTHPTSSSRPPAARLARLITLKSGQGRNRSGARWLCQQSWFVPCGNCLPRAFCCPLWARLWDCSWRAVGSRFIAAQLTGNYGTGVALVCGRRSFQSSFQDFNC